jgi:hypothetical protein
LKTNYRNIGFEVFTAVVLKSIFFWDMTPCSLQSCTRRFRGTYRLHLQGRRIVQQTSKQATFFDPEDGGDTFLRNVGYNSADYTASYPRRRYSSNYRKVKGKPLEAKLGKSLYYKWKK